MLSYHGNQEILKERKVGFLSSRNLPSYSADRTGKWIAEQKDKNECVVIGHHSDVEKKAFRQLINGRSRIILVLSKPLRGSLREDVKRSVSEGRLLIVYPSYSKVSDYFHFSAELRNKLIIFLSDDLFIAHARRGGILEKIISGIQEKLIFYKTPSEKMLLHAR